MAIYSVHDSIQYMHIKCIILLGVKSSLRSVLCYVHAIAYNATVWHSSYNNLMCMQPAAHTSY